MILLYRTQEWSGTGKQDYYWNEYRLEGRCIIKYKCHRYKFFDGKENNWSEDEHVETSWDVDDSSMPDWIRSHLPL